MGAATRIAWTDATWNPVTGCDPVSPGCDHCYAAGIARRFAGTPAWPDGFAVTLRPDRLDIPAHWRKGRRVFVCSTSDLLHQAVPDDYLARVFAVMADNPRHTFQVLTKRHARLKHAMPAQPIPNVHVGVTAENQDRLNLRLPHLAATPAAVRFLSVEPMLGPVTIPTELLPTLGWVIAGGESGRGARCMDPAWLLALQGQCRQAGVPFFAKQLGTVLAREVGARGSGDDPAVWPFAADREHPAEVPAAAEEQPNTEVT
jgi:protein gp37